MVLSCLCIVLFFVYYMVLSLGGWLARVLGRVELRMGLGGLRMSLRVIWVFC